MWGEHRNNRMLVWGLLCDSGHTWAEFSKIYVQCNREKYQACRSHELRKKVWETVEDEAMGFWASSFESVPRPRSHPIRLRASLLQDES